MKRTIPLFLTLILTACAATGQPAANLKPMKDPASLPDLGPAPEFTNDTWLNVDAPLRLADLRGRVVAIDMWTFG